MGAITRHYNLAKITDVKMKDLEVVGTGLGFGAMGGAATAIIAGLNKGSLDFESHGIKVPLDLFGSMALGIVGHQTKNSYLQCAALGMVGAASARIMTPHIKKAMGFAGEYDGEASMGWGADAIDPLVESAKYL